MPCKRSAGRLCQDLRRWNSHGLHGSNSDGEYELSIFDKKGNKTKIADGVTKAIREEDGDIVYDSRHDLMLYQKEESERIGIGIVDFWYADEMKTEQNFRLDW